MSVIDRDELKRMVLSHIKKHPRCRLDDVIASLSKDLGISERKIELDVRDVNWDLLRDDIVELTSDRVLVAR